MSSKISKALDVFLLTYQSPTTLSVALARFWNSVPIRCMSLPISTCILWVHRCLKLLYNTAESPILLLQINGKGRLEVAIDAFSRPY